MLRLVRSSSKRVVQYRTFARTPLCIRSSFILRDNDNGNKKPSGKPKPLQHKDMGKLDIRNGNSLEKPTVPEEYPILLGIPVSGRPLFPGFYKSVVIKERSVIDAIKEMLKRKQPYVGAFLLRNDEQETDLIEKEADIYSIGVFAQIAHVYLSNDGGSMTALLYPHRRIKMIKLLQPESEETESSPVSFITNLSLVKVENIKENQTKKKSPFIQAITSAQDNPLFRDQITAFSVSQSATLFEEPGKLADFAAAVSAGLPDELQGVLEATAIEERLERALIVLKKELMNAQLQSKISKDVESKISKKQQEYYYMEQLKYLKKKLNLESDGKDKLVEKFKARSDALFMPENAKTVFNEELNKLQHLEPSSSEFNVTRNYLDWITNIPWGVSSKDNYDISRARHVLDEDHYGLKDVKDRILEFIAVGKLRGTVEGKIICLVGPPGVGKTSVGKSIARALDREFFRFSVGGLSDVAEIKGHRRTYVGAMPGKVIQALKKTKTQNPLILIDEVDKIGKGHTGDPSSALLELLDPEQNQSFLDHYMDIPIDLSKVLFVCTANVIDTIPGPLLDRMEVINLSGYIADEKLAIAEKYLVPEASKNNGIESQVSVETSAISSLIKWYCRESGVRNLKKHIDKIYRKAAFRIATSEEAEKPTIVVTEQNIKEYVGNPVYTSERIFNNQPPAGVVMGLAWTSMGNILI